MNQPEFTGILAKLQSEQDLTKEEMRSTIGWLLSGSAEPAFMKQLLEGMADKGETVEELAGAAQALRDSMRRVETSRSSIVDTCGTGGDGSKTFNISTAAAIVAAAAGANVAKHGNRKITSSTGSADVLAELGVNLEAPPEVAEKCLEQLGICFCFAPHFHPAMRHVGPIRKEIPRPTIFNRLGPLANPASVPHQVLGVGDKSLQDKLASALQLLGTERSLVVRGADGVDELSISAPTRVLEVTLDAIEEQHWSPEDFGLQLADRGELFADDPASSAACIRAVLDGDKGPKRDVVVLNAAAALWVAGVEESKISCVERCQQAIDSGQAKQTVEALAKLTSE